MHLSLQSTAHTYHMCVCAIQCIHTTPSLWDSLTKVQQPSNTYILLRVCVGSHFVATWHDSPSRKVSSLKEIHNKIYLLCQKVNMQCWINWQWWLDPVNLITLSPWPPVFHMKTKSVCVHHLKGQLPKGTPWHILTVTTIDDISCLLHRKKPACEWLMWPQGCHAGPHAH